MLCQDRLSFEDVKVIVSVDFEFSSHSVEETEPMERAVKFLKEVRNPGVRSFVISNHS